MRSLLKVIKPGYIGQSDEVVMIPDEPQTAVQQDTQSEQQAEVDESRLQAIYEGMLLKAREESNRLSEKIVGNALAEKERIIAQAHEEAKEVKQTGFREGYAEGAAEKQALIESGLEKAENSLQELRAEHQRYMREYEEELKNFALEIASEIMCKHITEYGVGMLELVTRAISSVKDADWISVEVSNSMPELISMLEQELETAKNIKSNIEVVPKDLPPDACILQTSDGMIDASISTQVENLKAFLNQVD